ncbi:RNA polymerase II transcription mediator complex subunit 9-domain-containing protein [Hypoxylon argillaceum]|nr:RNA polymerase II transcription mediator complex subunit 9-domain-containing protein [Hypoxylon argillaceum]KAI1150010.1 RNA polymerase II transcription mediator complex subunit 9-domain-containing protein [Nemania diffusa]
MSTSPTKPLPLPDALNPDALDVLSELAHLLTRLRALPTTAPSTTTATPSHTHSQLQPPASQPQPHAAGGSHGTPTPTALLIARKTGELTLKEIPVATDALKHRFQRARTLVGTALPDLDRSLAEQEAEIRALEARIARQRDTLAKLRGVGARLVVGQEEGGRMEE